MLLEVIATSVEDAVVAERAGADRLELCAALSEGGLTPSFGLIESVLEVVDIPVHVMVRPHNRGFHYTKHDVAVMKKDIQMIQTLGAAGIVIGSLTTYGVVDQEMLAALLEETEGLAVTFHRAFDEIEDQLAALNILAKFPQIQQVLTAGGQLPAPQSVEQLKKLVQHEKVSILAGYGLTVEALPELLSETGVQQVHFGSGVRVNQSFMYPIDPDKIKAIKRI